MLDVRLPAAIRHRMVPRIVSRSPTGLKCGPSGRRLGVGPAAGDNGRMDIRLNGEPLALPAACTLTDLLAAQGLAERRVAVEVNGEIVPRSRHAERTLADGDVVEIVHALGGG